LLAFQIGSEVSLNKLATQIGVDVKTIQRHMDLLEKTFVIIRLGGFRCDLRQEITSQAKYYFFDNGIRNALIAQFNRLDQRNDAGLLWQNFCMIEHIKQRSYIPINGNAFFWRTYAGQEIDLVEEREGRLFGYELKWSENKPIYPPKVGAVSDPPLPGPNLPLHKHVTCR
jgi:predicted AAA+ superfamily ATPase